MWRKYFGQQAKIFGIDIDECCKELDGISGSVRIGSQTDAEFLESVVEEMGGEIDIVLDDGSHNMKDIKKTFEIMFERLGEGGIYMIEDLHTSYWRRFGGGYWKRDNFFNYVRNLIDDMHHWYHGGSVRHPGVSRHCTGIHLHDSITVFEKGTNHRPVHSWVKGE